MKRDALTELLTEADEANPPPMMADLPAKVRALRRRQDRRRGAVALGVAIAAIAGMLLWRPSASRPQIAGDNRKLRLELAQLDREAQQHQKRADQVARIGAQIARVSAKEYAMLESDPLQSLHEARQRAALILVRDGDRMRADPQQRQQAIELYRHAASLFPDTPAGQQAQVRINSQGA